MIQGPPTELNLADDVLLRNFAPETTVRTIVAVVTKHEVVALPDNNRTPCVIHSELGWDEAVVN
jgi:hypothetical protein